MTDWTVIEKARPDGTAYWTVANGSIVSAHKFITKPEAERYATLLGRM